MSLLPISQEAKPHCGLTHRRSRGRYSAAVELCLMAAGFAELYFEMRLMPWDYAAASLILTEAGGAVCDFNGEYPSMERPSLFIAANNKENCERILTTVRKYIPDLPY